MSNQAERNAGSNVKRAPASAVPVAKQQSNVVVARSLVAVKPDQRHAMIAEAAYYLGLQRKFEPGHEVEDWLLAEREVDGALAWGESCAKRY